MKRGSTNNKLPFWKQICLIFNRNSNHMKLFWFFTQLVLVFSSLTAQPTGNYYVPTLASEQGLSVVSKKFERGRVVPRSTPVTTGSYALVAGGSKGIGFAIAEALAKRGYNLVLIARHEEALNNAKQKLESGYGIHVEIL